MQHPIGARCPRLAAPPTTTTTIATITIATNTSLSYPHPLKKSRSTSSLGHPPWGRLPCRVFPPRLSVRRERNAWVWPGVRLVPVLVCAAG